MLRVVVLKKGMILLMAIAVSLVTLSLVIYPKEGLEAAVEGLRVFWNIVLPSLFSFLCPLRATFRDGCCAFSGGSIGASDAAGL
ncbi:MAG TPA: hypothetical protein VHR47_09950 [Bacillota bacterium]|nr:hypothetical protein [Bacillota bacterium]